MLFYITLFGCAASLFVNSMDTAFGPWFQCLTREQENTIVLVDFSGGLGNGVLKVWQA